MIRIYIRQLHKEDAHQAGQRLLAEILGEQVLCYGEKGKPYLQEGEAYFNLSHSAGFIGLAVSAQDVGLDLEEPRHIKRTGYQLPGEEKVDPLLLWVLKESYVKWTGEGISALRTTKITPLGEDLYEGEREDRKAILQAFRFGKLIGAVASADQEDFEIITK